MTEKPVALPQQGISNSAKVPANFPSVALPSSPAPTELEINDKNGWVYDPDAELAKVRAGLRCRNPNHACTDGTIDPHEIGPSCMAEKPPVLPETVSTKEKLVTCKGQPEPHIRIHACREPIIEMAESVPSTPSPTYVEWINEDELPNGYPYDEMFPHSKLGQDGRGGVRIFPKVAPSTPVETSEFQEG